MLIQAIKSNVYKNNQVGFAGTNRQASTKPFSKERCGEDIKKALHALGDKKLEIILHNASAPSLEGKDTGVGSIYSASAQQTLIPFFNNYGITGVQVEPEGMRPLHDPSPYVSNSFVYNPLIIDLEDLTKPENGALIHKRVYDSIVRLNPAKGSEYGDYEHAKSALDLGLNNAWEQFKKKSQNIEGISDPSEKTAIKGLVKQFDKYKKENGETITPYAIYSILTEKFNNDYYNNWPQEYRDLYSSNNTGLIEHIKQENADEIDKFIFIDMLAKNARDKGIKAYAKAGIQTEGDNPVAFSNQEVWAHKNAFLKDYKMGCPPDNGNLNGQAWGFAVLDPAKLFNHDGSLGESGKLLYDKCEKLAQDNQGGIRIDHIAGLIDPFVYKESPVERTAGRLFSSPHNPDLKRFAIPTNNSQAAEKFGKIMEKIVLPACAKAGVSKDGIICEDLGAFPDHARAAFERLGLGGMKLTQYHNGMHARPTDTIMIGSHDSVPLLTYVDNLYGKYGQDAFNHQLWTAVENSMPRNASHDAKQARFDKYRFDYNRNTPEQNKQAFAQMKFAELFTSPAKRVQIFWTDLLGSQKRYNTPGTSQGNWSLRMSSDFEKNFDPTMLIKGLELALKAQDEKKNSALIKNLNEDAQKMQKITGSRLNLNI